MATAIQAEFADASGVALRSWNVAKTIETGMNIMLGYIICR